VTRGDQVVWLPSPHEHGTGIITGVTEIGWLEVDWADGEVGVHPPQHLELADVWDAYVDRDLSRWQIGRAA
jgi:hypothetical protein